MELRVVPHPKLKRDYRGRRVRTTVDMENGWVRIPAGSLGVVDIQNQKGSWLLMDACGCCGVQARISGVDSSSIEFVEPIS